MGILVNKGFKIREQYIFTESIADTNAQMSDVKFLDPFLVLFAAGESIKGLS